ncbi:hypothetical protein V473_18460 [Sphingobium cupriresistens LL01]|uniref:Major facilitator superfamily (MFS) profile domain-containing protein n=1 Tax=Sphingobium cupriresistens LL01 TaxID=1420583 RepID=A0A0J7XNZ5_9SPHN|nr:hypothetical protein V473_18460 [Sphingobium cupriresistens LL01]
MDIGKMIDDAPVSRFQKWVVGLCSLATFLDGYDVQALGLAIPGMADDYGVAPTAFTMALSASLVGIALGAMILGPLADRVGRRPMLIWMMVAIGLSMIGAMLAPDAVVLAFWRLLTGLGIGGAVPTAVAMTAEYVPARRRAALVTLMIACMALGSFAAGVSAPRLEHIWGWRGIFAVGAALPLAMAFLLWRVFPESLRFLVQQGLRPADVRRQIIRISPRHADATPTIAAPRHAGRASVGALFSIRYRRRTILLWVIFWFNLFVAYSLIGWLPTLLRSAGWASDMAQRATGLLALGGIAGGLTIAWLADRGYAIMALLAAYVAATALLYIFTAGSGGVTLWLVLMAFVGAGIFGAQMALSSIAAAFYYPPELCSTGVGWYNGISRTGAIIGPIVVAALMKAGWTSGPILGLLTIPMIICAVGVMLLPGALRDRPETMEARMDDETGRALAAEIAELRAQVARLRDESDIRKLQYLYGYYDDYRDWDRLVDLFADTDCSVEIGSRGKYVGKAQLSRFFREVIGQNRASLNRGEIYNHLQLQMIITIDADGNRAKARSRALIQGNRGEGSSMIWAEGVYENSFVKIAEEWKIETMYWSPTFYAQVTGIESLFFVGAPESADIPPDMPARPRDPALGRNLVKYHF